MHLLAITDLLTMLALGAALGFFGGLFGLRVVGVPLGRTDDRGHRRLGELFIGAVTRLGQGGGFYSRRRGACSSLCRRP